MDGWTTAIAAYAAFVATGALFLEIRRWFESGPRLTVGVMPEMKTFNLPGTEDNTYLVVTVSNRGNAPTTITHLAFRDYGSWFGNFKPRGAWTAIVPWPVASTAQGSNLPKLVQPGDVWSGQVVHTDELKQRIDGGHLYVRIYASHTDKPISKRVHRPVVPTPKADDDETEGTA